jgi:hypothetical protein
MCAYLAMREGGVMATDVVVMSADLANRPTAAANSPIGEIEGTPEGAIGWERG